MKLALRCGLPLLFLACLPLAAGCNSSQAGPGALDIPATIVIVARPVQDDVADYVRYTGRTEAVDSVEIRARVSGFLRLVKFEDGGEIEAGAPLYEIDDREYQADLAVAQADLASAKARAEKAGTDFNRAQNLKLKGAISEEDFDRARSAKLEADAAVESTSAAMARKRLNVDFTRIESPLTGRISRNLVSVGNLVNADSTVLTRIVSQDPIYAYIDCDERTALTIQKRIREGELEERGQGNIPCEMALAVDTDYGHVGVIDFIDNRIDPATGTIRLRGRFENPKPKVGVRAIAPGLFAQVRIPIGEPKPSLLVTERAIGTDQGRKFLYVVNQSNEVVFRAVELGVQQDGLRVITSGLEADDRVIIDGLQRVRPGSVVDPKDGDMRSRPGTSVEPASPAAGKTATGKSSH